MYLPEVGCKLRLLVAPAGNILVRIHHLAPGLEIARSLALNRRARSLAFLGAHLLVEADAQQLHLHLFNLVRLWSGNRREETAGRIECAVGIISGKWLLMGPAVADVPKFADQRPLRLTKCLAENDIPLVPHHGEQRGGIPLRFALGRE